MSELPASAGSARSARTSGLAIAAAIVAFGFLGSRLLGIVRTIAIADVFGSGPDAAAYTVAFRLPDLIFQVLAGATLGSAFIPVFARLYRNDGEAHAWRLASNVLTLITVATAALCALAFIFAPWLVPLTAPGLGADIGRQDEVMAKAVELTRIMLLSPLLFAVSGIITGILNGRQRFLLTAIAPMLYNASIIFGALVLARPWGVEGLAIGVVLGAALHLGVQVPGLVRERMRYRPALDLQDAATREVLRLMGPRVVGLAAAQFNFVITTIFASQISVRAIPNLTYAWVIATLPLALFGMALSTAIFPRLAEQVAEGDIEGMRDAVSRAFRAIMFLTVPAAMGLAFLREPVTVLLLQRGAFTPEDAAVTAAAVGFYCLAIVPLAGIEIHSRAFYAMGDTRTPVTLAVGGVAVILVLSWLFWERFGVEGLAFAVSAAAWSEWLVLYVIYLRRTGGTAAGDLDALARYSVAGALMALALALTSTFAGQPGSAWAALPLAAGGAVGGAALYFAMALWWRLPGVEQFVENVRRRF
jgi:putative peptidoglycan lipid II flippase